MTRKEALVLLVLCILTVFIVVKAAGPRSHGGLKTIHLWLEGLKHHTESPAPPPEQAVQRKLAVPPNPVQLWRPGRRARSKATDIVFSSGLPLDKTMNTLWCSSMAMAWQEANAHFPQGKLALQNEPELTAQLNAAPPAKASLPEEWYYTGFGELPDETLLTRLTTEPKAQVPRCGCSLSGLVRIPTLAGFTHVGLPARGSGVSSPPMRQEPEGLTFPGLVGRSVPGCLLRDRAKRREGAEAVRRHVKVLYAQATAIKSGLGRVPANRCEHLRRGSRC